MAPFYRHYEVLLRVFFRIQGSSGEDNIMKISFLLSPGNFILHVTCNCYNTVFVQELIANRDSLNKLNMKHL